MRRSARARIVLAVVAVAAVFAIAPIPAGAATPQLPRRTCTANLANEVASVVSARQLITVEVARAPATTALVELWQRSGGGAASCFTRVAGPFPGNVGLNGTSTDHHEGDDTTPVGVFGFGPTIYGIDPNPGVHYPYHRLVCGDWWDEDPTSAAYNEFVHEPCGREPPFGPRSEALWRTTPFYDWMAVIEYNTDPTIAGRGSGIFLHVTAGTATAGCVAIPAGDLVHTLRWLAPTSHPLIAIGTRAQLAGH